MNYHMLRYGILSLVFILLLGLSVGCTTIPGYSVEETTVLPSVPVSKPVIVSFTATPETILSGQSVTLNWNVSNAKKIIIQPGIYEVELIGTLQVTPASDFNYTLIAANEAGNVASHVSITVLGSASEKDQNYVGYDPVTGRNQDIGFEWEQLCLSSRYQVQIAKDIGFTMIIFDSGIYAPGSSTSPALLYLAGGRLEAGHSYYWRARVKQATTGQKIISPWSVPQGFTISAGYPIISPYQGVQLLSPVNSCCNYPAVSVPFTWSPYKGTTKYRFVLASDPELNDIIIVTEVAASSYVYDSTLDYNTNYFWQVRAIEPAPGDPSSIFSFTTESKPVAEAPLPVAQPATPLYMWVVIGIGAALILTVIILIAVTKHI
jgi:hypothetical protein